jgi:hypothetical protein
MEQIKTPELIKGGKNTIFLILGLINFFIYSLFFGLEFFQISISKFIGFSSENTTYLVSVFLLLLSLIVYIAAYKQVINKNISVKIIFLFFLAFNVICLFITPKTSVDLYCYIGQGRVLSAHQANPYIIAYNAFPNDALYNRLNTHWARTPSPYGPLFLLIAGGLSYLSGNNALIAVFIFKLFFLIINCLIFYLIYKIFNKASLLFLYSWNPLIIFEFIINGHNDILTILFLVACLYFFFKKPSSVKNYCLAGFFLLVSGSIKYLTWLLIPILYAIIIKNLDSKQRIKFLAIMIPATFIVPLIFYIPFWLGHGLFSFFPDYILPAILSSSDIRQTSDNYFHLIIAGLFYNSNLTNNFRAITKIGRLVFLSSYIYVIFRLIKDFYKLQETDFLKYACIVLFCLFFFFLTFIFPWYLANLLVLLMLYLNSGQFSKYNRFIFYFTAFSILYYIVIR